MKELLLQYAKYNVWANELLLATINRLPETQHRAEVVSSFPSLYQTILHMLDAETIWWQRMKLQENITVPSMSFRGDMQELVAALLKQNKTWLQWIQQAPPHAFEHEFFYSNSKRERFKQPVSDVLMQIFNHGSFHRGQLVSILRQLGVDKIPQTDFIVWSRKQ